MHSLRFKPLVAHGAVVCALFLLGACASTDRKQSTLEKIPGQIVTKAKFAEGRAYGAASERVVQSAFSHVPRGGGRAVVGKPYKVNGRWYKPEHQPNYNKVGIASWYGANFHGRKTANGEIYDQTALSAAHPTLPLPSYARVTNLANDRSVIVRVNDRGPFHADRLIDLSYRTAELLGTRAGGLAKVRVEYVGPAQLDGQDEKYLVASYEGPGSTHDSKLAARNVLLAHAGLPPEAGTAVLPDTGQNISPDISRPTIATSTPVLTAVASNIPTPQPAPDRFALAPSIQLASATLPSPAVIASNAAFVQPLPSATQSIGQTTGQPIDQIVTGDPFILQPRLLAPTGTINGTLSDHYLKTPDGHPAQIKATDRRAYLPEEVGHERIASIFDQVIVNTGAPLVPFVSQKINLGIFADYEKAMNIKDALARYGDVTITPTLQDGAPALLLDLTTSLPFAFNAARALAPDAVLVR